MQDISLPRPVDASSFGKSSPAKARLPIFMKSRRLQVAERLDLIRIGLASSVVQLELLGVQHGPQEVLERAPAPASSRLLVGEEPGNGLLLALGWRA